MNGRKIMVMLPVMAVSIFFIGWHYYHQYRSASHNRLIALIAAILLFYAWVAIGVARREQRSLFDCFVQASYYVYIFCVLTLTGYFILFNQVSAHHWWQSIETRVARREGVNLEPGFLRRGYHYFNYEGIGNTIMLLPLGIYFPLLYKHLDNFLLVTGTAMLVSISIELMQLATYTRVSDIDDVLLNTAGAAIGYIIYYLVFLLLPKKPAPAEAGPAR